jgi:predicted DNA-binding transcriptional regulator AlpA
MDTKYKIEPKQTTDYFLRINSVLSLYPVSRAEWWRGVKSGKYPPAIKLTARTTVWPASAIDKLIADTKGAAKS